MKCALYIRVSTQDQIENYSIESQRERLEAYCKSKGWSVYDTFIDGGYSGATIDRPALQQMLSELEQIDVVIVYKLDRLSRSQRDTLSLIEEHFLKSNVDFVSLTETLDTSTPFGKAMIGILSVFAQLERETIAERMRMGHIKRAENGYHASGGDYDPSGYNRVEGLLEVNDEEARHIKLVYDLYEQYHSISKIQKRLKEIGEPVWRFRRYRDILSNRLYIGEVSFAKKWYKGKHEPIISEEQFERVQGLLERHKGHNAHKAKESLFSGLITCTLCGEKYQSYTTTDKITTGKVTYRYYICRARRFPSEYDEKCMNKNLNASKFEEIIINEIKLLSLEKRFEKKETKEINYSALIKKVDEKIERVISLYAEGTINKQLLDKQIKNYDEEKRGFLRAKYAQEKNSKPAVTKAELDQYVIDLKDAAFPEKQAIIQKLIKQIYIDKESIEIVWEI